MSKERTVLLRTTSFSVEAGEAAVGARPATIASDEKQQLRRHGRWLLLCAKSYGRREVIHDFLAVSPCRRSGGRRAFVSSSEMLAPFASITRLMSGVVWVGANSSPETSAIPTSRRGPRNSVIRSKASTPWNVRRRADAA
jgi:hypothetical protein